MAIKSLDEYTKEAKKATDSRRQEDKKAAEESYDAQIKNTESAYNREIADTKSSYTSLIDENNVQKLINERAIAENMANLGLTNSGLNRTQQTAAQLSHANNLSKIQLSRQKAVDSLAAQLADKISSLNSQKESALASIDSSYDNAAFTAAQSARADDVEAENKLAIKRMELQAKAAEKEAEAAKENAYIIKSDNGSLSFDYQGSLNDNGVAVYYEKDKYGNLVTRYVDKNSGKTSVMERWVNPYKPTVIHEDLVGEDGEYDPSKAFSNGYQPNNINGQKLKVVKTNQGAMETVVINGRSQKVFSIVDPTDGNKTSYYTWYGGANRYVKLKKNPETRKWEFAEDVF